MHASWPILQGKRALQLGVIALGIYAILLPFQHEVLHITYGILAFWLVYVLSFTKARFSYLFTNRIFQFCLIYYAWLAIGALYSTNTQEAGLDLTLKITLLLWPLGMATWPELASEYRDTLLKLFIAATILSAAFLMAIAYTNWLASGLPLSNFYQFTSSWVWIPNHYIALYASFGFLLLLHFSLTKHVNLALALPGLAIFILLLVLTSVRIQFVALPVALLASAFAIRSAIISRKKLLLILIAFVFTLGAFGLAFPSSRQRILETADELRSIEKMVNNKQTNHRVFIWQYGWQVCQENLWFGTGTGAADDALNIKLKDCDADFWNGKRTYKLSEKRYNYHNAFLQHFATNGIIGFLLFCGLFIAPFWFYGRSLTPVQVGFLTLTAIAFFTESMLERQAGVLFFGFFYALLFIAPFDGLIKKSGKKTA